MLFSRRVPDVEFLSLDLDTVTLWVVLQGSWMDRFFDLDVGFSGFSKDLVLVFSELDIELI